MPRRWVGSFALQLLRKDLFLQTWRVEVGPLFLGKSIPGQDLDGVAVGRR